MTDLELLKEATGYGPAVVIGGAAVIAAGRFSAPIATAIKEAISGGFKSITDAIGDLKSALIQTDANHRADTLNDQAIRHKTAEAVQANVLQLTELRDEVREARGDIKDIGAKIDAHFSGK